MAVIQSNNCYYLSTELLHIFNIHHISFFALVSYGTILTPGCRPYQCTEKQVQFVEENNPAGSPLGQVFLQLPASAHLAYPGLTREKKKEKKRALSSGNNNAKNVKYQKYQTQ